MCDQPMTFKRLSSKGHRMFIYWTSHRILPGQVMFHLMPPKHHTIHIKLHYPN